MARTLLKYQLSFVKLATGVGVWWVERDVRPDLGTLFGDDGEAQLVVFESDPGDVSER